MARQKKRSAFGIFCSFFLKAMVIILGLVILAMGTYLVWHAIKYSTQDDVELSEEEALMDNQKDDLMMSTKTDAELLYDNGDDTSLFIDESAAESISYDDYIIVLNATETAGLAGAWRDKLAENGYTNVVAANYLDGYLDRSKIVAIDDVNIATIRNLMNDPEAENNTIDSVNTDAENLEGVKAFIIIGRNDDILSE